MRQQKNPVGGFKRAAIVRELDKTLDAAYGGTFKETLNALALQSRLLIGAHQSAVSYLPDGDFQKAIHTHSFSEKYAKYNSCDITPTGKEIWSEIVKRNVPMRMTDRELKSHKAWRNFSDLKDAGGLEHPPMVGCLAVPAQRLTGEFIGVFQLSDRYEGDFTKDDELLLIHFARVAGMAFELYYKNNQLQESERKYQDLYENAPDMYVSVDSKTAKILQCNHTLATKLRYTKEEIIGQSIFSLYHPDCIENAKRVSNSFLAAGRVINAELELKRKDGSPIPVMLSVNAVRDEQGNILDSRSAWRDITDRKHAEQQVRQRTAELEAANKELGAFSYSVSHDLRAPLRRIDGFSRALLQTYADKLDEQGKHYLERVCAGAQQMGELIDDLLNFSRITRRELRRGHVDLHAVALQVAKDLQKTEPDRDVEFVLQKGTTADGDGRLLRVALQNLIDNAWKFTSKMEKKGRIEFGAVRNVECGTRNAELGNDVVVYFVRDNGTGFDMTYADKLFGAFQRLHREDEFEGTGIGLATVQRIIHKHGGRVWAEGALGKGATFYFTLGG